MVRRIFRRVVDSAIILFAVSAVTFFLVQKLPGDPVIKTLGVNWTPEKYGAERQALGLDRPAFTQYRDWLSGIISGDPGKSLLPPRQEISAIISNTLPVTLELTVLAVLVALLLAIPLALWCSYREGGILDRVLNTGAIGMIALPPFVIAFVLILLLVVLFPAFPRLGWVPMSDDLIGNLKHVFVPVLALALPMAAFFQQILRNDLLATLKEDYVLTARALGESPRAIMFRWALRPASLSLVTVAGMSLGGMIGGTAIIEIMFDIPGFGLLLVNSISDGDVPVVQAITLIVTAAFVLVNTMVDLLYGILDPRIRRAATE